LKHNKLIIKKNNGQHWYSTFVGIKTKQVIENFLEKKQISEVEYSTLTNAEKMNLYQINKFLDIYKQLPDFKDNIVMQFETLSGSIYAENDSPIIIHQLKNILHIMIDLNLISRNNANTIITELIM
jgi:hypothetical protein